MPCMDSSRQHVAPVLQGAWWAGEARGQVQRLQRPAADCVHGGNAAEALHHRPVDGCSLICRLLVGRWAGERGGGRGSGLCPR